jgi:molecular chaperone DnaK
VHVSAKDLGTGKEQKIRIESSSGLSEDEIKRMIKEAEVNAAADKKARELAETKNETESLAYALEKTLSEAGDKIPATDKQLAQDEIKRAHEAVASNDFDRIKAAHESISQIAQKIGSAMYQQGSPEGGAASGGDAHGQAGSGPTGNASSGGSGEKVVDADYTVVDDDKK